jgi:hypothetical protein
MICIQYFTNGVSEDSEIRGLFKKKQEFKNPHSTKKSNKVLSYSFNF